MRIKFRIKSVNQESVSVCVCEHDNSATQFARLGKFGIRHQTEKF